MSVVCIILVFVACLASFFLGWRRGKRISSRVARLLRNLRDAGSEGEQDDAEYELVKYVHNEME